MHSEYSLHHDSDGGPDIVVSLFNLIKCLCIFQVLRFDHRTTLCILGDAIASFLEKPDVTTKSLGNTSCKQIAEFNQSWSMKHGKAIRWKPHPVRWRHAVSFRQWTFVMFVSVSSEINIIHYLIQAFRSIAIFVVSWALIILGLHVQRLNQRSISLQSLWVRGFGRTTSDQIVNWKQPTKVRFFFFFLAFH